MVRICLGDSLTFCWNQPHVYQFRSHMWRPCTGQLEPTKRSKENICHPTSTYRCGYVARCVPNNPCLWGPMICTVKYLIIAFSFVYIFVYVHVFLYIFVYPCILYLSSPPNFHGKTCGTPHLRTRLTTTRRREEWNLSLVPSSIGLEPTVETSRGLFSGWFSRGNTLAMILVNESNWFFLCGRFDCLIMNEYFTTWDCGMFW